MKTMTKIFLALLIANASFAADYSAYESLLQSKLAFDGEVEVSRVTPQANGDFVVVEVTSYGETRENWCLIKDLKVLQCMDNWFYKK